MRLLDFLKGLDDSGLYGLSDHIFLKTAFDISKYETNKPQVGYFGKYYGPVAPEVAKSEVGNIEDLGVKHFKEQSGPKNSIQEYYAIKLIAPLINKHTNLIAPVSPYHEKSFVHSHQALLTQHIRNASHPDDYINFNILDFLRNIDLQLWINIKWDIRRQFYNNLDEFVTKELNSIGADSEDIKSDNIMVKNSVMKVLNDACDAEFLRVFMQHCKNSPELIEINPYFDFNSPSTSDIHELTEDFKQIISKEFEGGVKHCRINFYKTVYIIDFGMFYVTKDPALSVISQELKKIQKANSKQRNAYLEIAEAALSDMIYEE